MARLAIEQDRVRVHLDWWEKVALRRSHLTIPLRSIAEVSVVDNAGEALGAGRFEQATHIPGLTSVGTLSAEDGSGERTFAVCHRRGPGLVLGLRSATFNRIVLSTPLAQQYAELLRPRVS